MPIAGRPRRAEQDSASVASGGDPGAGCGALSLRSHVRAFAVGSPKGPLLRAPARPIGEPSDKADRPESPVPSGFRRNGLICFVARLANSTNYSLRPLLANEASHLKPLRPKRDSCGTCSEVPSSWLRRTLHAQCGKGRGPARARARIDRGIKTAAVAVHRHPQGTEITDRKPP